MGTLEKDGSNPLSFDGRPESCPLFKEAIHRPFDQEDYGWVVEGGDVFCAILQAASDKAAKSRDMRKRHSLNKCRGLPAKGSRDCVDKRVGNDIRALKLSTLCYAHAAPRQP